MRKRMMVASFFLSLVLGNAQGQTLYKCVAKGRPTSFQNQRCTGNQREAKAVNYTPDDVGAYRPDVKSRPYVSQRGGVAATISRAATPSACEQARQRREYALGRNNQGGNYAVRVQLNDAVQRACN